jgi:hypothetical protein
MGNTGEKEKRCELVPKLIDYALKRMVRTFGSMEQALAVFRPIGLQNRGF